MASSLTLWTTPGDYKALKVLIAARYNGVAIDLPPFKLGETDTSPQFLAKSPLGKAPVLETDNGCIFESNAIARYVARIRRDTELYGATFFESAQVDSWLDFSANELEIAAMMWLSPIFGHMPFDQNVADRAQADLFRALGVLEAHLLSNTFLVGNGITLADIAIVCALFNPMRMILDTETRARYPAVQRWFLTCVHQEAFQAVLGNVPLCNRAQAVAGDRKQKGGKKDQESKQESKQAPKPKKEKKEKKKEEPAPEPEPEPEEQVEKKPKCPLDLLPKSSMVLDVWKKTYSNIKTEEGLRSEAMPAFWEMLDRNGWAVFFMDYNHNNENTRLFMTSNLVTGFIQRCDPIRKYGFGAMHILGAEGSGNLEVTGCWLLRGANEEGLKYLLDENPDAEYYTWTKADLNNEEHKQLIADMWCSENQLKGMPIADCKVFK